MFIRFRFYEGMLIVMHKITHSVLDICFGMDINEDIRTLKIENLRLIQC